MTGYSALVIPGTIPGGYPEYPDPLSGEFLTVVVICIKQTRRGSSQRPRVCKLKHQSRLNDFNAARRRACRASVSWVHRVAGLSQTSLLDYLAAPMPFLVGVHDTLMSRVNALPTEDE